MPAAWKAQSGAELTDSIRRPEGDVRRWRCEGAFEAAFGKVHENFHHLMEAGGGMHHDGGDMHDMKDMHHDGDMAH